MLDLASPFDTVFKSERQITLYDLPNADMDEGGFEGQEFPCGFFAASVELSGEGIVCLLYESEYCFTAQQCGELADKLGMLIQAYARFHGSSRKNSQFMDFIWCKIFYQMIMSRSGSQWHDSLDTYESGQGRNTFGATGQFRHFSEDGVNTGSYGVFMGICDELNVPLIAIEDRVFRLDVDDAIWLMEQLCVGGYILARALAQSSSATYETV